MRNWSIRIKLLFGFLLVAATAAVVGVVGIGGLNRLWQNERGLHTTATNRIYAKALEANISQQHALFGAWMLDVSEGENTQAYIADITALDLAFQDDAAFLVEHLLRADSIAQAQEIQSYYYSQYTPRSEALTEALRRGDTASATALCREAETSIHALQDMTSTLSGQGVEQMQYITDRDGTVARRTMGVMLAIVVLSLGGAVVLGFTMSRSVSGPARQLERAARQLTEGDIGIELAISSGDELGRLARQFEKMVLSIREQADLLQTMAAGNYAVSVPMRSDKDVINQAIATLVAASNSTLRQVSQASAQVASGGDQIAQGASSMALHAAQQAASIEQFNSALSEVRTQTQHNADNAQQTLDTTQKVSELVATSSGYMQQVLEAMDDLDVNSQQIKRIVGVIEDLAFQTNILALNASVEAARAGPHGKGFTVVADEVRNLATKSAQAAKDTAALIQGGYGSVQQSSSIVRQTEESLREVAEHATGSLERIREIAHASTLQAEAMDTIREEIEQITGAVEANSATAQQAAAAAQQMAAQASLLNELVGHFRLQHNDPLASATPPPIPEPPSSFALEADPLSTVLGEL